MQDFIPSERFATGIMDIVRKIIEAVGLSDTPDVRTVVYLVFTIGLAIISGRIVQWLIETVIRRMLEARFKDFSNELADNKVLSRCGRLIPPLVLLSLIPFAFNSDHKGTHLIILITVAYTIVTFIVAINSVFSLIWSHYNTHHNDKNLPLKGILDITRGAMWIVGVIVIISMIVDKSPIALLTGLGAFAAVLLLIFKNSILGLVAGIELSDNDMLRVDDWISIPGSEINGIVIDVSLVVVKVRNWNNTVSMLPPYTLVSKHFVNWRYMKEGGSRQIEMSVPIDINTVRPLSDDELHKLQSTVPLLSNFIDKKMKQRDAGKIENVFNSEGCVNGTIDTNLGLFRAYVNIYLQQHPYIYTDRMHMVRILQPTPTGFPMQIFAYVTTSQWPDYEAIQADIFEHITAIAPTFDLSIFEQPSSRSVFNIGQNPQTGSPYYGNAPIHTPTPNPSTNKLNNPNSYSLLLTPSSLLTPPYSLLLTHYSSYVSLSFSHA